MLEQARPTGGGCRVVATSSCCIGVGGCIAASGSLVISSSAVRFVSTAAAEEDQGGTGR